MGCPVKAKEIYGRDAETLIAIAAITASRANT
ncbi:hypothetical protein FHT86_001059 [Rhizobium sp. BK313]|nr:hypothetical protein [Rhizobium sp. BK313]